MVTKLFNDATGRYSVTTETSSYVLDMTARTSLRIAGAGAGTVADLRRAEVADLRQDGEAVPLLVLISCEVNRPLSLLLDIRGDGLPTLRTSTLVQSIEPIEPIQPIEPDAVLTSVEV